MARITISLPDSMEAEMRAQATSKGYPSISNYILSLIEKESETNKNTIASPAQLSALSPQVLQLMMKTLIENTVLTKYLVKKDNPAFLSEAAQLAQTLLKDILAQSTLTEKDTV